MSSSDELHVTVTPSDISRINSAIDEVLERLGSLEASTCNTGARARSRPADRETPSCPSYLEAFRQGPDSDHPGSTPGQGQVDAPGVDIQGEFAAIKDTLQRIKLPAELRLNDGGKQGIRRQDHPMANIMIKSARYVETNFRQLTICATDNDNIETNLESLFRINSAHMKYLQDEYAGLLVQSTFDPVTSRMFRSLQRNNSALTAEHVGILQSAASISAAATSTVNRDDRDRRYTPSSNWRGSGNRGRFSYDRRAYGRGSYNTDRQDPFQRFNRGFGPSNYRNTSNNASNNSASYNSDPQI